MKTKKQLISESNRRIIKLMKLKLKELQRELRKTLGVRP